LECAFEQAGSSLTLFADRLTQTTSGLAYPSSWFHEVQPIFIIILAPVFAGIWQKMGEPSHPAPASFFTRLLFAGFAFVGRQIASMLKPAAASCPLWLIVRLLFGKHRRTLLESSGLAVP